MSLSIFRRLIFQCWMSLKPKERHVDFASKESANELFPDVITFWHTSIIHVYHSIFLMIAIRARAPSARSSRSFARGDVDDLARRNRPREIKRNRQRERKRERDRCSTNRFRVRAVSRTLKKLYIAQNFVLIEDSTALFMNAYRWVIPAGRI